MTTELEKEFFKAFGIEPISKWHKCKDYNCVCCDEYDNCSKREFIYPEITDRKHLDCDAEGHFICGLDDDILDHEGIYCNHFEEYIEDDENVENN